MVREGGEMMRDAAGWEGEVCHYTRLLAVRPMLPCSWGRGLPLHKGLAMSTHEEKFAEVMPR